MSREGRGAIKRMRGKEGIEKEKSLANQQKRLNFEQTKCIRQIGMKMESKKWKKKQDEYKSVQKWKKYI